MSWVGACVRRWPAGVWVCAARWVCGSLVDPPARSQHVTMRPGARQARLLVPLTGGQGWRWHRQRSRPRRRSRRSSRGCRRARATPVFCPRPAWWVERWLTRRRLAAPFFSATLSPAYTRAPTEQLFSGCRTEGPSRARAPGRRAPPSGVTDRAVVKSTRASSAIDERFSPGRYATSTCTCK